MKLFFVRHGETIDNAKRFYQKTDSPLTDLGKEQVRLLAKSLQNFSFDEILCSPLVRTSETGKIINQFLPSIMKYNPLLAEIKLPYEIEGKPKDSLENKKISKMLKLNFHNPTWKYSDEESFEEIKKRAVKFIESLKPYDKRNILVISHNLFISAVVGVLIFGYDITSKELFKWMYSSIMENSGISLCEHLPERGWRLIFWNDCHHLRKSL